MTRGGMAFLAGPDTVHPGVGDHLAGGYRHPVQVVLAPVPIETIQPMRREREMIYSQ